MIIDSHCHLDYPNLFDQLEDVVNRAELNEVKFLLTICTTLKSFEKIELIVKKYKNIYGTIGIHPHEAKDAPKEYLDQLKNKATHKKVVAIGEIGLDYHYNFSDPIIQKKIFSDILKFIKINQI